MRKIFWTDGFVKWLEKLRDSRARLRIFQRIKRLADGNPGDCRFLGDVSELRVDYGPSYRVYFRDTGREIVILLCGGDKTTQAADIAEARRLAKDCDPEGEEK